jgi:purine nucleosidase
MAQKVILDTDIGDDVDDVLALALVCASPELELVGVTTVFGNVDARSRQARTVLSLAGEVSRNIPVCAGCGASIASRPLHNLKAYLERELPVQNASCLPESDLAPADPRHGVDFIIETILGGNRDIIPITIGAMTNLAMAIVKEPKIIAKIPKIVSMAAEFERNFAEWNILCDPEAAAIVFNSGIPVDVTTWTIGNIATFRPEHVVRLAEGKHPITQNLSKAIALWAGDRGWMPHLYDPVAVATMIQPDLVTWKQGRVTVELQGQNTYGYTKFTEDPAGPHKVAFGTDRDTVLEFYLDRVLAFGS